MPGPLLMRRQAFFNIIWKEQEMKICKSCGKPIAEGNKFCSTCGTPVSNSKEKGSKEKTKKSPKVPIIITVIIAILCISIPLTLTLAKATKVKSNINLGNKYLSESKYKESILTFEKVISIDKKNVEAHLKLIEIYLKTKGFEDAKRVSMEVLNMNPSDKEIYIKVADVMISEGRPDDAASYLKKVFEKTKHSIIGNKLEALKAKIPVTTIEASALQDSNYSLPDKIKLNINNFNEELFVKWANSSVDTKNIGTYTFDGIVEEYDRKVKLTLKVTPKDLFLITGKEVAMDKKQKEDLDNFFTIFSDLYMQSFDNSNISDEELIRFGISFINNFEMNTKVELDQNNLTASVKAYDVDEKCIYYFGKKPSSHKSIQDYTYSDGKYKYAPESGEAFVFSQADKLFDLGDNLYRVDISTYVGSSGFSGNIHASPSELLSGSYYDNENHADAGKKMSAIIRKATENNTEKYILLSLRLQNGNTPISTNFSSWKATASSFLTEPTVLHQAPLVNDKNATTAWVEGAQDDGVGEWVEISGTTQQSLSGIRIINGYAKSSDTYGKNNRVKKIRIELSDGIIFEKELKDGIMDFQTINLDRQVKTDFIKITILEVYRGTIYKDTCISEIDPF